MQHDWKVGDRAKVVIDQLDGFNYGYLGSVFTVQKVRRLEDDFRFQLEGVTDDGECRAIFALRCKPIYRVKAIMVLTPRTYSEARTLAARFPVGKPRQLGSQCFKPWDFSSTPRYEELS